MPGVSLEGSGPGRTRIPSGSWVLQGAKQEQGSNMCVVVAIDVLTLTHVYNAVRGHRTGSNNSGRGRLPQEENKQKQKIKHTITETNRIPQDKKIKGMCLVDE